MSVLKTYCELLELCRNVFLASCALILSTRTKDVMHSSWDRNPATNGLGLCVLVHPIYV